LKEIDMTVESIGANLTSSSAALQNAGLSQQDFLKVLTTQLQFQDPLKPMDNDQFLAQMAQFATLGLMQQQTDSTNSLLTIQTASQTVGLLGKSVQLTTNTGTQTGSVTTITFQADGTPQLAVKLADGTILTGIDVSQVTVVQ
jgi:flagellar basal-body rod modification protein FlgD